MGIGMGTLPWLPAYDPLNEPEWPPKGTDDIELGEYPKGMPPDCEKERRLERDR